MPKYVSNVTIVSKVIHQLCVILMVIVYLAVMHKITHATIEACCADIGRVAECRVCSPTELERSVDINIFVFSGCFAFSLTRATILFHRLVIFIFVNDCRFTMVDHHADKLTENKYKISQMQVLSGSLCTNILIKTLQFAKYSRKYQ